MADVETAETELEVSPLREAAVAAVLAEFHRLASQRGPAVGPVISARDRAGMYADAVLAVAAAELERAALAGAGQPLRRVRKVADVWRDCEGWISYGSAAGMVYAALDGRRYTPARDREGADGG